MTIRLTHFDWVNQVGVDATVHPANCVGVRQQKARM